AAKLMTIDEYQITSNIWDLASKVRFKAMRETYYKGASGAMLVYDITRHETYDKITDWIQEMKTNNENKSVPMVLIGNKSDLRATHPDAITPEEGEKLAQSIKTASGQAVQFLESSAKTGENVEMAFEALIQDIYYMVIANK
ncbi:MAG: GTP-binding protein, partial [Candidatus Heimdallarchaeota archaeon]|nr:GTP-binding protein [Candidatus Heimdallarchaeota archaeon]